MCGCAFCAREFAVDVVRLVRFHQPSVVLLATMDNSDRLYCAACLSCFQRALTDLTLRAFGWSWPPARHRGKDRGIPSLAPTPHQAASLAASHRTRIRLKDGRAHALRAVSCFRCLDLPLTSRRSTPPMGGVPSLGRCPNTKISRMVGSTLHHSISPRAATWMDKPTT